jgi:hypothetical protein
MIISALAEELADLERRRLRCLVEVRVQEADELHTSDFQIVTPNGGVWNKQEYLGGIAAGQIDYRRFEPVSEIDVMVGEGIAVLKYRSEIDISVAGQEPGPLKCWHLDCYERGADDGLWRVRWSQATEISATWR